jgi:hypothetical protein
LDAEAAWSESELVAPSSTADEECLFLGFVVEAFGELLLLGLADLVDSAVPLPSQGGP